MTVTRIVASLVERSIAGVSRSSKKAFEAGADIVEIRLDHLKRIGSNPRIIREARGAVDGAAMATLRSIDEGGASSAEGNARRSIIDVIIESGFEYVDLELARDKALLHEIGSSRSGPRTIASSHFQRPATKAVVRRRLEVGAASGAIAKVAMPCEDAAQAVMLAELAKEGSVKRKPFVLIGMGAQGQLTRACAAEIGSELVYACLSSKEAAPGQLDVRTQAILSAPGSVILGLIGHPISHSVSKPMQEAALASVGLNGIYLPLDVPTNRFDRRLVSTLFDIGFKGLNITIPHKQKAFRVCDVRRPAAEATAAVNTLHRQSDRIIGENTDVVGFSKLIALKKVPLRNARVLVVGAGGAARAVCKVCNDAGAEITVSARRPKTASDLARTCGARRTPYSRLQTASAEFDVMINATPVGTRGTDAERTSLPDAAVRNSRVFVDLVYNPPATTSMTIARGHGRVAHGGLEMLVRQGEEAFRIWTGKAPDVSKMRRAARRALDQ